MRNSNNNIHTDHLAFEAERCVQHARREATRTGSKSSLETVTPTGVSEADRCNNQIDIQMLSNCWRSCLDFFSITAVSAPEFSKYIRHRLMKDKGDHKPGVSS